MSKPTMHELFDATAPKLSPLPHDEELALVLAAQGGDEAAYNTLLRQFIPALRGYAITESRRANGYIDRDETRSNVLLAFAEAVAKAGPDYHLSGALKSAIKHTADDYQLVGSVTIPERTRQRFLQVARAAGGNLKAAAALAPEYGMSPDVFAAVAEVFNSWGSIEGTIEHPGASGAEGYYEPVMRPLIAGADEEASFEDRLVVEAAFAAVDELTGLVIRDAYGFSDYEPVPDAEIAHRRGYSRSKVQRLRTEGLVTMHAVACDGHDGRCNRPELHPELAPAPLTDAERELLAQYEGEVAA